MIKRKTIFIMAFGTLIVFGGLGLMFIPYARQEGLRNFLFDKEMWYWQIGVGLFLGLVFAKGAWGIVQLPFMEKTKTFFLSIFSPLKLNLIMILFISLCAGIGEELLFRGAIQPFLGIWLTAFLFVLLHGYLNPFNLPLTMYGIYMVLVIGVFGLMTEYLGIISAITAHVVVDVLLLKYLSE